MLASIITPNFNSKDFAERLLKCLEAQTFSKQAFEWIVIDDGSTEAKPDFFSEYNGDLRLITLALEKNCGRALARNSGLKKASGEIVVFLDVDMEVSAVWLEILLRSVQYSDGVVVGRLQAHPSLPKTAFLKYFHSRGAAKLPQGSKIPGKYFMSANSAIPKKFLDQVNGFDETFRSWGGEDLDLGLRLEREGIDFFYESRAMAWHEHRVNWNDTEKRYSAYGKDVVPLLLERFSEAEVLLSLDNLRQPLEASSFKGFLKRLTITVLLGEKVYKILRTLTIKFPKLPWPDKIFDLMIFYLYSRTILEIWRKNCAS